MRHTLKAPAPHESATLRAPSIAPDRSGEPADRLREEILAALIFVDGNRALDDHDTARLLRSFQLLGQLAGCLERETALSFQVRGAAVETLQHRLLARMLRERAVPAILQRVQDRRGVVSMA